MAGRVARLQPVPAEARQAPVQPRSDLSPSLNPQRARARHAWTASTIVIVIVSNGCQVRQELRLLGLTATMVADDAHKAAAAKAEALAAAPGRSNCIVGLRSPCAIRRKHDRPNEKAPPAEEAARSRLRPGHQRTIRRGQSSRN